MHVLKRSKENRRAALRLSVGLLLSGSVPVLGADQAPELVSKTGGAGATWESPEAVRKAAESGDLEAVLELGKMYEFGRDVPEDPLKARGLYLQAAAGGKTEADFRLARLLSEGLGGPADLPGAYDRYLKAARAGLPLAQYNVGAMLASARGVRRDYVEGLAWIILATRDKEVDPAGEQRLRERLARRPQDIAAAERRAAALQQEIDEAKEAARRNLRPTGRPAIDVPVVAPPVSIKPLAPPPPILPPSLPPPIKVDP